MLVDAHTHLDHFDQADWQTARDEIERLPVKCWAVSTDIKSYQRTLELAGRSKQTLVTFGIHPWEAHLYADRLELLEPWIEQSPHLGEIGLDFHWVKERERYALQHQVFTFFLERASRQQKIVNLHTKGAESETADLLERHSIPKAVVHWYSGPLDPFQRLVAYGSFFTFGIELLYSEHIAQLAAETPLDQMLTETDGPTALAWLTDDREKSMPRHVQPVLNRVAEIKKMPVEACQTAIFSNWTKLFE
ncbi:MAG: TatD family hydrolase [Chloroflexota bacterium]